MTFTDLAGTTLQPLRIDIERGPVENFARAVNWTVTSFPGPGESIPPVPIPATFLFCCAKWGAFAELQPARVPGAMTSSEVTALLMNSGGTVLHGEQSFEFVSPIYVGDTLRTSGIVADVSEKQSRDGNVLSLVRIETNYADADGKLRARTVQTLIHKCRPE